MSELLSNISIVLYVIAGICLVIAVLLWFVFDIPTVFGDLSGRTARKSIARMRENNEKSGVKSYRSSNTNRERGKLTGVPETTGDIKVTHIKTTKEEETGLLAENTAMTSSNEETALLNENQETALLNENEETALLNDIEETGLLIDENETALLIEPEQYVIPDGGKHLVMIESIMLIHTAEVI